MKVYQQGRRTLMEGSWPYNIWSPTVVIAGNPIVYNSCSINYIHLIVNDADDRARHYCEALQGGICVG